MRPRSQLETALDLCAEGRTDREVARVLGIPRETVRDWRRGAAAGRLGPRGLDATCPVCSTVQPVDRRAYAYLLGLYLGDGCLSRHRGAVYKLRVSLDARQPRIIDECTAAIRAVAHGRHVGFQAGRGCIVVGAYWKHWTCLFPQHGPGRKHARRIELVPWQQEIVEACPEPLLRGLIHSDGCRVINRVAGCEYPRYFFTNLSADIQQIFRGACDRIGVAWTQPSLKNTSVARARDVARLDAIIDPKG